MSAYRLRRELLDDPLAIGYAAMTDAQALASLTDATLRDAPARETITGGELYDLIDEAEFLALTTAQRTAIRELYTIENIIVGVGSRARGLLGSILTVATAPTSRNRLRAAVTNRKQSRADELGIRPTFLRESTIAAARLPDQP